MPAHSGELAADSGDVNKLAELYSAAVQDQGEGALVRNLATRMEARRFGDRILPVTINRSEPTGTYVCSPHTAFVRYLREEIPTLPLRALHEPLGVLVSGFDRLLHAARIDDIVHLNNWLLSTNLNGGLSFDEPDGMTRALCEEFPHSLLAIRSLNGWADRPLIESLAAAGWAMVPSRQVWVVEDLGRDWSRRRDTRRDAALARRSPLVQEEIGLMEDADARRIAELYGLLYLDKYSRLNPDYSPAFVTLTHRIGMIRYQVFRGADGVIQSVAGCFALGSDVATPIVGYDTARPAGDGLYRLAMLATFEFARRRGLRLNLSSGAAGFKRNRGARPQIEYSAVFARHLSRKRRLAIGALRQALAGLGVPIMRRFAL